MMDEGQMEKPTIGRYRYDGVNDGQEGTQMVITPLNPDTDGDGKLTRRQQMAQTH
jgi:hypothetical protein